MKTIILTIGTLFITSGIYAQYTYKPAKQYTYERNPVPNTYNPPQSYNTQPQEKTISMENKSMEAKTVEIYTLNTRTYKWEYLKTIRIVGGGSVSYAI